MFLLVRILFILFISFGISAQESAEDIAEDLIEACMVGDIKSVKHHLSNGAKVNAKTGYGKTPSRTAIMWAASRGKKEIVRLLIESGAEINSKDDWKGNMTRPEGTEGWTPLIFAADSDHEDVVEILIENGADVNVKTKSGVTALSLAKLWRNDVMIKLLKRAGAKE